MSEPRPAAGIASVAHLFLSDLRNGDDAQNKPVRKKPTSHSHPPPPQQADQPDQRADPPYILDPHPAGVLGHAPPRKDPQVIAVLASHLRWEGAKGVTQFARHLAGAKQAAALLNLEPTAVHLRLFYHKDLTEEFSRIILRNSPADDEYAEDQGASADAFDPLRRGEPEQIWQALERITSHVDFLLIACGPGQNEAVDRKILTHVHRICILVHPQNDHLISSYQLIKTIGADRPAAPIGVYIAQVGDPQQARDLFNRLNETARRFANTELIDFGFSLADQGVAQELICRIETAAGGENSHRNCVERLQQYLTELVCVNEDDAQAQSPEPINGADPPEPPLAEDVPDAGGAANVPAAAVPGQATLTAVDLDAVTGNGEADAELPHHLAEQLLPDAQVQSDPFAQFLTNCGLKCCKTQINGATALVVLIRDADDLHSATWALSNYPKTSETLYAVTAVPVEKTLLRAWRRQFADARIVPALEGLLGGKPTLIFQKS